MVVAQWLRDSQRLLLRDAGRSRPCLSRYFIYSEALVTSTEYFNFSPEHLLGCSKTEASPRLLTDCRHPLPSRSPLPALGACYYFLSGKTWISILFVINPIVEDKLLPSLRHRPCR